MSYTKKMLAFTLAEVLITLGIIGIIAQMTIPTLINDISEKELKVAWKKNYSVLSQAFAMVVMANNGSISGVFTEDKTGSEALKNAMSENLAYIKDCKGSPTYNNTGTTGSGATAEGCWHDANNWKYLYGGLLTYGSAEPGLILKDGTMMYIDINSANCSEDLFVSSGGYFRCGWIVLDVNGFKKPNTFGKDIYSISITQNLLLPSGARGVADPSTTCIEGNTDDTNTGSGCAAKYLME